MSKVIGAILVSSDEFNNRANIVEELRSVGYRLIEAETGLRVLELARRYKHLSLAFIDTALPDLDSVELVKTLRLIIPQVPIVLLYETSSLKDMKLEAVKAALEAGADYLLPYDCNNLQIRSIANILVGYRLLQHNLYYKSCLVDMPHCFEDFVANSASMQTCLKEARAEVGKDGAIFIGGESGTGRRLIAKAIHNADKERSCYPFVNFYCDLLVKETSDNAAWQASLDENIAKARKGTLCLINLDSLSKTQLAYLSSALKEAQCRIICLVISNVRKWQRSSQLAEFYRDLQPHYILVPSLRQRREDIETIAAHIVWQFATQMGIQQKITGLSEAAKASLSQYDWPGNISELEKLLYHALLLGQGPLLKVKDFPKINGESEYVIEQGFNLFKEDGHIKTLATIEDEVLQKALEHYKGRLSEVARRLKIGRSTVYRRLEKNLGDETANI